jgi:putative ABC transport system substrate-binding protein
MDRRAFLGTLAGSVLAAPLAAEAQPTGKIWRIGVLGFGPATANMVGPDPKSEFTRALVRGLRELGYVYGQHFVTEPRGAEGKRNQYPALVGELIDLKVDVIVAVAASLPAVKQVTSTIPIVFPGAPDPVGQGYVQSLARPGGNLTGLSFQTFELVGKRLELLKQLVPTRAPVAVLWYRGDTKTWPAIQTAVQGKEWRLLSLPIQDASEMDQALRSATTARAGTLLVAAGGVLDGHPAQRTVDLVAKHRLPAMYDFKFYVDRGGLACYGPNLAELWRAAAGFVDKILKGAKPADLPVEQPTKYELVMNRTTARALGLTIPQSLLQRADQVIE